MEEKTLLCRYKARNLNNDLSGWFDSLLSLVTHMKKNGLDSWQYFIVVDSYEVSKFDSYSEELDNVVPLNQI